MTTGKKSEINHNGQTITIYTIANKGGMSADICNFGAKTVRLYVPDRDGRVEDIVLGFDTPEEVVAKETYFGAVCGRVANRIKDGTFTLDGKTYRLAVNNGTNHLHGGETGFNAKVWDVVSVAGNSITLHYLSADGEENYPGNLHVTVTYEISDANEFNIRYEATTDKPTMTALTQHAYFNLKGAGNGAIHDQLLQLNADYYTVLDDSFAPSGEIRPVANTAFDFREPTVIGERIDDQAFAPGRGLDNNWCLRKSHPREMSLAGFVYDPQSGRKMEVLTTFPGIQIYTANWVEKQIGKKGKTYNRQEAICMEAQSFPNSANIPFFPSIVLRPEEKYDERCVYKFSTE
jgi:aldose 1-epimerase